MIDTIDFSRLPGYSKLFNDFINKKEFFNQRFPANNLLLNTKEILLKKSSDFDLRNELIEVINNSFGELQLCKKQKINLENLADNNSLVIVTGQQVGFLGGPLYTFYKIYDAIILASKLSEKFSSESKINFIPVFWLEDNDHDNLEASQAFLFDKNYKLFKLFCSDYVKKEDRTCVSERIFEEDINNKIDSVNEILNNFQYKNEIVYKLKSIYQPGKKWNSTFIELLNSWFGENGLLFLKASTARQSGLFAPLVQKELSFIGKTDSLIKSANINLEANGFHIQAKSSLINLFFHKEYKRYKINQISGKEDSFEIDKEMISKKELQNISLSNPELFSPNVLLRNIFQDYVLPTAAYIAGPSEIGYSTQILELYKYFGVEMPEIISRHSISIVGEHFTNWLNKFSISPNYFFRKFIDIENQLTNEIADKEIEKSFKNAFEKIDLEFVQLQKQITYIDKTLEASSLAARHKTQEVLEQLKKKSVSAQKKNQTQLFEQYRKAANYFYPIETLQERYFSPINFMALVGEEKFKELIKEIIIKKPNQHYFQKFKELINIKY